MKKECIFRKIQQKQRASICVRGEARRADGGTPMLFFQSIDRSIHDTNHRNSRRPRTDVVAAVSSFDSVSICCWLINFRWNPFHRLH